jgi:hypothetical protein
MKIQHMLFLSTVLAGLDRNRKLRFASSFVLPTNVGGRIRYSSSSSFLSSLSAKGKRYNRLTWKSFTHHS